LIVQFQKGDAIKNVGVVKLNLGETIDASETIRKKLRIDKLNP